MQKYKFIDKITSDVLFEAYGKDLKELFENAAEAMASVMCKIDKVEPKLSDKVEVKADKLEELMIHWLQEIIAMCDTEERFYSKFKVKEIDEKHLVAEISGESMTPAKGGTVVKAVTYYQYKLEKTSQGYKVRISLDI